VEGTVNDAQKLIAYLVDWFVSFFDPVSYYVRNCCTESVDPGGPLLNLNLNSRTIPKQLKQQQLILIELSTSVSLPEISFQSLLLQAVLAKDDRRLYSDSYPSVGIIEAQLNNKRGFKRGQYEVPIVHYKHNYEYQVRFRITAVPLSNL
jgi:hypothetical protein